MGKLVGKRNYSTNNKATEEHCAFHCAFRRASTATAFSSTAATFAASGATNMLATCPWRTGQGKSSNLTGSTMSTNLTGYSFIATIKKNHHEKTFSRYLMTCISRTWCPRLISWGLTATVKDFHCDCAQFSHLESVCLNILFHPVVS